MADDLNDLGIAELARVKNAHQPALLESLFEKSTHGRKSKIRNAKQIQHSKYKCRWKNTRWVLDLLCFCFGFVWDFGFRISDLAIGAAEWRMTSIHAEGRYRG
jgi:hypothetical protein